MPHKKGQCDWWEGAYGGQQYCILPKGHDGRHRLRTEAQDRLDEIDRRAARTAAATISRIVVPEVTSILAGQFQGYARDRFVFHISSILAGLARSAEGEHLSTDDPASEA